MQLTNRCLLALSGGLDSVYTAYHHLTTEPQNQLVMFHVDLFHSAENRLESEKQAVMNVLQYFYDKGWQHRFKYVGSPKSDYHQLPRITIKDIQIVAMWKAVILKTPQYSDINRVKLSWHKGEVDRDDIKRGFRVKKMFEALELDRPIELEFPIEHKTRKEMVSELPYDLLKHVRSCRKPKYDKPCRTCKTCLEYIEEGLQPL
jgi:7-cyano-7-deazaguanine synthase in queuosine biosynthesis